METTLQARGSTYILPSPITSPKYASSPGRHWFPTPAFYAPLLLVTIATLLFGLFAVPSNVSAQSNGPKPTNLTAQVVDGGVLLNWDAPAEDSLVGNWLPDIASESLEWRDRTDHLGG